MSESGDRLRRGWAQRLVSTSRVAGSAAKLAAKQLVGAGDAGGVIGERLAAELDQMKGVAMKVGQILSYFDGVMPEETHRALRKLQVGSEPVAYEAVAKQIEAAFGATPEQVFERFDHTPIAAASIGQVHRAQSAGRELAVKVQYPGVKETMVADVSRLRTLSTLATLATAVDGPAMVEELAERFLLECDYELEARHQRAFKTAFAKDTLIVIPDVLMDLTRSTVLTSEWCEGQGFYDFESRADGAQKNATALILVRFALRSLYGAGVINADPHPGNYLFAPDGRVIFLDFGCVRSFEAPFIESERRIVHAVLAGNKTELRDAVLASGMVPKEKGFDFELHWNMLRHQFEPYLGPRFRFSTEYIRKGLDFSRPGNPNLRRLAISPPWIWVQRLVWGLHAVLARLEAQGPFGDELRAALETPFTIVLEPPQAPAEVRSSGHDRGSA